MVKPIATVRNISNATKHPESKTKVSLVILLAFGCFFMYLSNNPSGYVAPIVTLVSTGGNNNKEVTVATKTTNDNNQRATTSQDTSKLPEYNPAQCANMVNGHCNDPDRGGAWSYRKPDQQCAHTEQSAPRDHSAATSLARVFGDVKDVLDFGGGLGVYLLAFRDSPKVTGRLVVVEPHDLQGCLFQGLEQDTTNLAVTPLDQLFQQAFDLVMTIEVVEHIPVDFHDHIVAALIQATRKWLLFSAAAPGQPGEGHVGPSMKTRDQWIQQITSQGTVQVDEAKTKEFHDTCGPHSILRKNSVVFRRI